MKTNEQLFEQTCKERMLNFNLDQFKRDNPSLYNAIMMTLHEVSIRDAKQQISNEEQWR